MHLEKFNAVHANSYFAFRPIVFFLSFLILACSSQVAASTGETVAFSWRENPIEDNVLGYRLYYGEKSRFYSNGNPVANFSYDHYINLKDSTRCDASDNYTSCQPLSAKELQCEDEISGIPRCTIYNMSGYLFFTLTAYNGFAESGFTHELELDLRVIDTGSSPGGPPSASGTFLPIQILLLKEG